MVEKGSSLKVAGPVGHAGGGMLRRMVQTAIDGVGAMPSAKKTAGNLLAKRQNPESAIDAVIRQHVALAGAQGFVTNLGGIAALPVTLPTNLTGLAMVELRMVACIAHLRGYDVDDARVRSAIMMILLGKKTIAKLTPKGMPASPLLVATAPVFNAELDRLISEHLTHELLNQVGGQRALTLAGRRVPLVGGGVGAALDGWSTWSVAAYAREVLPDRRPRP